MSLLYRLSYLPLLCLLAGQASAQNTLGIMGLKISTYKQSMESSPLNTPKISPQLIQGAVAVQLHPSLAIEATVGLNPNPRHGDTSSSQPSRVEYAAGLFIQPTMALNKQWSVHSRIGVTAIKRVNNLTFSRTDSIDIKPAYGFGLSYTDELGVTVGLDYMSYHLRQTNNLEYQASKRVNSILFSVTQNFAD